MRNDRFFGPLTAILHCFQRRKNLRIVLYGFCRSSHGICVNEQFWQYCRDCKIRTKPIPTILSGHFINSAGCFKRNFIASGCILFCVRTLGSLRCVFNMHVKTNFVIVYCLMFFQIYLFLIFISHSIFTPFSAIFFPSLTLIFVL